MPTYTPFEITYEGVLYEVEMTAYTGSTNDQIVGIAKTGGNTGLPTKFSFKYPGQAADMILMINQNAEDDMELSLLNLGFIQGLAGSYSDGVQTYREFQIGAGDILP